MSLNSFFFIVSFCLLVAVLYVVQAVEMIWKDKQSIIGQFQLFVILFFSIWFVIAWDWRYLICAVAYSSSVYVLGILEERTKYRRAVLLVGLVGSILMLGYFKYTNFFIDSFSAIFDIPAKRISIILPVGISFYTFSGISYLIDIYRRKYQAERNILHFFVYMLFFGKLTSGPIVRANTFLPQIKNYRGVQWNRLLIGIQIFIFGLFKKIVLADHLSVFVDDVFYAPSAYHTATIVLGIISYSLQIYYDFSGYSDMAIGIAKIIGFDFEPNFNLPYLAQDLSEFWKRWHISFSSWLQEYLYIPLGGSRKGKMRVYFNLIFVMLISGLWHGAGVTFIVWGFLHGIASCVNRLIKKGKLKIGLPKCYKIISTYCIVALLWVPFRADNIENTVAVWKGAFTLHSGIIQPYTWTFFAIICLLVSSFAAIWKANKEKQPSVNGYYPVLDLTNYWNLVLFFTFIGLTILMGYFGNTVFIYGKF